MFAAIAKPDEELNSVKDQMKGCFKIWDVWGRECMVMSSVVVLDQHSLRFYMEVRPSPYIVISNINRCPFDFQMFSLEYFY